jgi:septal ring-binding cell division protein DamX
MVDQVPVEQGMPQVDTSEVALLETPTVEEKVEVQTPEAQAKTEEVDAPPGSKLSEMHGDYTIQVVAYREKNKAEEMVKRLEFSGYPSFVEKVPMKGIDWYTVRIGRYPSRDDAKKAVITFADQLQAHYFIDKVRKK